MVLIYELNLLHAGVHDAATPALTWWFRKATALFLVHWRWNDVLKEWWWQPRWEYKASSHVYKASSHVLGNIKQAHMY